MAFEEIDKIFELSETPKTEIKSKQEIDAIFGDPLGSSGAGTVTKDDTYLSRIGGLVEKRGQEVAETMEAMREDEINYGEFALQTIGKGFFGTVMDIAGETVGTILSELTPDSAEEKIKEWIASGAEEVLSTQQAQDLLELYQGLDPNTRKNIESATNIAFGWSALGSGKKVMTKPINILKKSAASTRVNRLKDKLKDTVLDQSTKARAERQGAKFTAFENEMLNDVALLKGIDPKSPNKNIEIIQRELNKIENNIGKKLKQSPKALNIKVTQQTIKDRINTEINALKKGEDGVIYSDKSLKPVYEKLNKLLYDKELGYAKGTLFRPHQIHKIRQDLDRGIKKLSKEKDTLITEKGASGDIHRAYRNALNNLLDELDTGVDTKSIRSRFSRLLTAKNNLSVKKEPKSKFDKVMDYAKSHPFLAGSVAQGAGMFANPKVLAALGLIGGSYATKRAITSPALRELLAKGLPAAGIVTSPKAAPVAGMFYGKQEDEDIAP